MLQYIMIDFFHVESCRVGGRVRLAWPFVLGFLRCTYSLVVLELFWLLLTLTDIKGFINEVGFILK